MGEDLDAATIIPFKLKAKPKAKRFGPLVTAEGEIDNPNVRTSWALTFDAAVSAHRFCQMDQDQVEGYLRGMLAVAGSREEVDALFVQLGRQQADALERVEEILRAAADRVAIALEQIESR